MNQEKIGKFIAECRKQKELTQAELGERLGVTEKSISNWENGRNMPDLSLFKPLCEELGITINELMSGETIQKENYQERFEENIVNTIDYSTKRFGKYRRMLSFSFMLFGLFLSLSALVIFPSESSWSSIYSVFGVIIFMIGSLRMMPIIVWYKRLLLLLGLFFGAMSILLFADYVNVLRNEEAPMFRLETTMIGDVIYYDTLFYDVYRCHADEEQEYWVIEPNKTRSEEELMHYCDSHQ